MCSNRTPVTVSSSRPLRISLVLARIISSVTPAGATVTVFCISSSGGNLGMDPVDDSISSQSTKKPVDGRSSPCPSQRAASQPQPSTPSNPPTPCPTFFPPHPLHHLQTQ